MSLPIKSVLIALKRDLEQVTLIAVGGFKFCLLSNGGPN